MTTEEAVQRIFDGTPITKQHVRRAQAMCARCHVSWEVLLASLTTVQRQAIQEAA